MPSSRLCGKYVTRSEISARARRRAFAFGSLARNGLIGVRAGVPVVAAEGRGGGAEGAGVPKLGRMTGAVGRGASGAAGEAGGTTGGVIGRAKLGPAGGGDETGGVVPAGRGANGAGRI